MTPESLLPPEQRLFLRTVVQYPPRPSRWVGPIVRGLASAVFGAAALFLISMILIGV